MRRFTPLCLVPFTLAACGVPDETVGDRASAVTSAPVDTSNPFFAAAGTNGRTCETCHQIDQGFSITAAYARSLPITSELFLFDGSDCLAAGVANTSPDNSTEMRGYGNTRVELGIPSGADFSLATYNDTRRCATPPSASLLRMYRRPVPSSNAAFLTTVMWDGRENVGASLTDFLKHQANDATLGHEQAAAPLSDATQTSIAAFELDLFDAADTLGAQSLVGGNPAVNGGPSYLQNTVAPAFVPGGNDPLRPGFNPRVFTLYAAWEPGPRMVAPSATAAAIGRGEMLFNTRPITLTNVPGLNGPNDPAQAPLQGTCSTCHNNANVGNHTLARFFDLGVSGVNAVALDVAHLPTYTFRQTTTGRAATVTDPGRALVTGRFADLGKMKVPTLRGLARRAPYFHNGGAATLNNVVTFYNARFRMGLTPQNQADLVAFLQAL